MPYFTSDRIIIAKLAGLLTILAGGLGDIGNLYARWVSKKTRDLTDTSLKGILKSDKDNYAIPYSDIIKVEIRKSRFFETRGILIHFTNEQHNFLILTEEGFKNCLDLISATMSDKLSTR